MAPRRLAVIGGDGLVDQAAGGWVMGPEVLRRIPDLSDFDGWDGSPASLVLVVGLLPDCDFGDDVWLEVVSSHGEATAAFARPAFEGSFLVATFPDVDIDGARVEVPSNGHRSPGHSAPDEAHAVTVGLNGAGDVVISARQSVGESPAEDPDIGVFEEGFLRFLWNVESQNSIPEAQISEPVIYAPLIESFYGDSVAAAVVAAAGDSLMSALTGHQGWARDRAVVVMLDVQLLEAIQMLCLVDWVGRNCRITVEQRTGCTQINREAWQSAIELERAAAMSQLGSLAPTLPAFAEWLGAVAGGPGGVEFRKYARDRQLLAPGLGELAERLGWVGVDPTFDAQLEQLLSDSTADPAGSTEPTSAPRELVFRGAQPRKWTAVVDPRLLLAEIPDTTTGVRLIAEVEGATARLKGISDRQGLQLLVFPFGADGRPVALLDAEVEAGVATAHIPATLDPQSCFLLWKASDLPYPTEWEAKYLQDIVRLRCARQARVRLTRNPPVISAVETNYE